MAKLPRITQKIFGKNAPENQITTFGSIKAGAPVYTQSPSQIMNANFEEGWSAAVEDDYAPYRQDRNAVDTAITQQLGYLFQDGIPEWDAGTTYYKGSVVKVVNGNALTFYKSIADNNTVSVNTTASWHKMLDINASNQIVSPSINTPTISGGSMSNGTFANPTFSGNVNVPLASQSSSTDSTIAASIGWVNNPSLSTNIVHRTGAESISGNKTFNDSVNLKIGIELKPVTTATNGGYIDFHYAGSSADYTSRIIENASGILTILANGFIIPAVASSDNSNHAATTAFVKSQDFATNTDAVHKSGIERITGTKTVENTQFIQETGNISGGYIFKGNFAKGETPAVRSFKQVKYQDNSGEDTPEHRFACVDFDVDTDGTATATLRAYRNVAGSTETSSINIKMLPDGSSYTSAPASDEINSIVTTTGINKSNSGYVKFGNGIIIQWGEDSGGATDRTITFPTPFTTYQSYSVSVQNIKADNSELWPANIADRHPTYFHLYSRGGAVSVAKRWIAVGY